MIALSVPGTTCRVVVPAPAHGQFVGGGIHVVGYHLVAGIDTACQEDAGLATVQIGRSEEEFAGAVSVTVTPGSL